MFYIKFSYNLCQFAVVSLFFVRTLVIFEVTMSKVAFAHLRFLQNCLACYFIYIFFHIPSAWCSLLCRTHWRLSSVTFSPVIKLLSSFSRCSFLFLHPCLLRVKCQLKLNGWRADWPTSSQHTGCEAIGIMCLVAVSHRKGKIQVLECAFCGLLNENM